MSDYEDFLLEIGCEELPAGMQPILIEALKQGFENALAQPGIALQYQKIHAYVTPRRLAILIEDLQTETLQIGDQIIKGPPVKIAIDANGNPTAAGLKFAEKCGVAFEQLERGVDSKGEYLHHLTQIPAQKTAELLPLICEKIIAALPIAKRMRWGAGDISFVRPVHWIVLLLGKDIIPAKILGQNSDRLTYGHRFHHPEAISITEPKQYETLLEKAYVIADADKRRKKIREGLEKAVSPIHGNLKIDEELLTEVTAIVEWPVPFLGKFDKHFLEVPHEALSLAMKQHQKVFSVYDKEDKLLPYFVGVSNIENRDLMEVMNGNERVIHARLADAKFFFESDSKQRLEDMAKKLDTIIFQVKLGNLGEKTRRIVELSKVIASLLNAEMSLGVDPQEAYRAGLLCKADLVSDMVGEFPELQGIMGGYYAKPHEASNVAIAIKEHYQPRFAQDALPQSTLGAVVSMADKLDTLVGLFSVGEIPKGDKDPYGLRRAALGVLKIIVAGKYPLNLWELLQQALVFYSRGPNDPISPKTTELVFDFMMERFKHYYLEQGIAAEIFMAVLAKRPLKPYDFALRLQAVQTFCALPQSQALAAANKRVSRILEKEAANVEGVIVQETLLVECAEKALCQALVEKKKEVLPLYKEQKYEQALLALASLQPVIDTFFEKTMVMVEDKALRNNRLALLVELRDLFSQAADLSCL